ncbi:MAG: hypothetical protein IKY91_06795, partial [Akkermansia sp.]|nr:hypothetical protein [Akkermansia sp.]
MKKYVDTLARGNTEMKGVDSDNGSTTSASRLLTMVTTYCTLKTEHIGSQKICFPLGRYKDMSQMAHEENRMNENMNMT